MLILLAAAWLFSVTMLVWVYVRPPTRSGVALRRRLDDLEESSGGDHMELKRLVKRYRRLEGHVYGSMEPDEDEAAPDGPNPSSQPGSGSLALIPDSDFPEDAFQAELARRRGTHA